MTPGPAGHRGGLNQLHHVRGHDPQLRRAWRYSHGFGQVLRRHYPVRYVAYRLVRSIGSGVVAACKGRFGQAIYRFTWGLGTLRGCLIRS